MVLQTAKIGRQGHANAAAAGEAKQKAHAAVKQAREEIAAEAAAARQALAAESQSLAGDIARSILERRAN